MAESKLVPPPPPIAKSRAARLPPLPRSAKTKRSEEIQLGESSIMSVEADVEASAIELEAVDVLPLPPRAADAALDALSRPAPPIGRIKRPGPPSTPPHVDVVTQQPAAPAPAHVLAPPAAVPVAPTAEEPLIDLPAEDEEDVDWNAAIARAKEPEQAPKPAVQVSRGMSDRMGGIEALSTIAPSFREPDRDPYAGDTFEADRPKLLTPARVGLFSGAASALVIVVVHLLSSGSANATPDVAAQEPVRVIHAAAVFNEADDEGNREDEQAQDYAVIDNEKARKLGTLGMRALEGGRPASARRMFKKALKANPRSRLALAGLGRHALQQKRYADAVDYLERAVKIEPRKADNRRYLGDAYAGQGRIAKARHQYNKAVNYGDALSKDRLRHLEP